MNAYAVQALQDMGINIAALGCVMLDVDPIPTADMLPADWAYTSTHPDRRWINGLDAGDHITLLYGLLSNANTIRPAIEEVLDGWEPGRLEIESVGSFPSTFDDEPYECIVGHIKVTDQLLDAHARLSLLPHIDTHPTYRPHLTLGYVRQEYRDRSVQVLGDAVKLCGLSSRGLNYGDPSRNP